METETKAQKRREIFPVESFRHLESKIQQIRREVMNRAAELADVMGSDPDEYLVSPSHVDSALLIVLSEAAAEMQTANHELASARR